MLILVEWAWSLMGLNLIPTCEKTDVYYGSISQLWMSFFFALFPADRDDMGEKGQLEAAGIIIR